MHIASSYSKYSAVSSGTPSRNARCSRSVPSFKGRSAAAPSRRTRLQHKRAARLALLLFVMLVVFSFGALVNAYAGDESDPDESNAARANAANAGALIASTAQTNASRANSTGTAGANAVRTVDVAQGDTLWSIAQQYKPEAQDVRDYVLRLKKINNLKSSALREGQVLILP